MGSISEIRGKLTFDFRYRGIRCREQSQLDDTKPNRKRLEKVWQRIKSEITLVHGKYIPASKKVEKNKWDQVKFYISALID